MARRRKTVSLKVARAESWFGVKHAVPRRGTAAHRSMMRKYTATHKVRKNPTESFVCPACGGRGAPGKTKHRDIGYGVACPFAVGRGAKRSAKKRPRMARKNPWSPEKQAWITREGRKLHPQNCPIPLAASMITQRRTNNQRKEPKVERFSNCDYRSAEIAMRFKPRVAGSKFAGRIRKGAHKNAPWIVHSKNQKTGHEIDLSFYEHAKKAGQGTKMLSGIGRLLDWWPSGR